MSVIDHAFVERPDLKKRTYAAIGKVIAPGAMFAKLISPLSQISRIRATFSRNIHIDTVPEFN